MEDKKPVKKAAATVKKPAAPKVAKPKATTKVEEAVVETPVVEEVTVAEAAPVGAGIDRPQASADASPSTEAPAAKAEKPAAKKAPATPKTVNGVTPISKSAGKKVPVEKDPKERNYRKEREGTVVSDKMQKTCIVAIIDKFKHKLYKKTISKTKRIKVHDENNECGIGDTVLISETRPISKDKHWRLVRIIEKAK